MPVSYVVVRFSASSFESQFVQSFPLPLALKFSVSAARSFRYSPNMQTLVEDFLQYLRHGTGNF
jgi:hypothetical protein